MRFDELLAVSMAVPVADADRNEVGDDATKTF
jgi:hypothetical protein